MNVLVLGSGGREHALCWIISKSNQYNKLYIAPGNSGTGQLGENVNLNPNDFKEVEVFALKNNIDFIIVGPEDPIVKGIFDYFDSNADLAHISVLAPSAKAAQLEGSKDFAKEFMEKHNIPTAKYKSFTKDNYEKAKAYIVAQGAPIVIKADGLAAGKGVTVASTIDEAINALDEVFLDQKFGSAGAKVVIEECLIGIEMSVFVLTDGKRYVLLPEAKDYKRIGEGDTGPNTGGMGAISPVPFADEYFMEKVKTRIIDPTINGLKEDNLKFRGFVFIGLMNVNGDPFVIEYNVRLGDPEAEAILSRISNDFLVLMLKAAKGELNVVDISITDNCVATVMLVSGGYPGSYQKGNEINGLNDIVDSIVFHAGAKKDEDKIVTSGGRVLAVTSSGNNLKDALEKSMKNAEKITFENKYYRKDIGQDLLSYLK